MNNIAVQMATQSALMASSRSGCGGEVTLMGIFVILVFTIWLAQFVMVVICILEKEVTKRRALWLLVPTIPLLLILWSKFSDLEKG